MRFDQFIKENNKKYYENGIKEFTTPSEISPVYSECIACHFANILKNSNINKVKLLELGPGNCTFIKNVKNIFNKQDIKSEVFVLEQSNYLKGKESEIKFLNNLDDFLNEISDFCIIFANEFFDALPIRIFKDNKELYYQNKSYEWKVYKEDKASKSFGTHLENLKKNYTNYFRENTDPSLEKNCADPFGKSAEPGLEKNWVDPFGKSAESGLEKNWVDPFGKSADPGLEKNWVDPFEKSAEPIFEKNWVEHHEEGLLILRKILKKLKNKGVLFISDYGFWENLKGKTLQFLKKGVPCKLEDFELGEADITSHIPFFEFEKVAKDMNFEIYKDFQGKFLTELGALERLNSIKKMDLPSKIHKEKIILGTERLLNPNGMGSLFKVLILS